MPAAARAAPAARLVRFGSSETDTLYGGGEADRLYGGAGDDTLYGSATRGRRRARSSRPPGRRRWR
ncbi:MAG: hypothetical protein U5P41_02045 [Gammaproteobacteria bacterium]|nr:hypothetical protein [Gammaproteobacteria bacterium]